MIGALRAEARKLNWLLVILLVLTGPGIMTGFSALVMHTSQVPLNWTIYWLGAAGLWSAFMLPMTVVGLTALLGYCEHRTNTWSVILTTPTPRWAVFAAKITAINLLTLLSTALLIGGLFSAGAITGALWPEHAVPGATPWGEVLRRFGSMILAAWPLMAIQLWVALRFSSFAAPIAVGIGGTFFAVAGAIRDTTAHLPWLMPMAMMARDPAEAELVLRNAMVLGAFLFAGLTAHMSWREWR
ncbi:MAG: ABC transporter permease [Maricaulaceae bacterium]